MQIADAVVVNGESGRRYISGLTTTPVHVVAQAVPGEAVAADPAVGADPDTLSLLYVGNLVPEKGLQPCIAGLHAWAARTGIDVSLTLVGQGPERAVLETLAGERLALHFAGHLPYHEARLAYSRHEALVFPTLGDEWGLVVNESLQSGCPVIGSIHSQAVESLVEPGYNGFHFDPEAEGSLEAALDAFVAARKGSPAAQRAAARDSIAWCTPHLMAAGLVAALRGGPPAGGAVS